jgi:hypothetical protein
MLRGVVSHLVVTYALPIETQLRNQIRIQESLSFGVIQITSLVTFHYHE